MHQWKSYVLYPILKATFSLVILFNCTFLFSQNTQQDSINTYFKQITSLIDNKSNYKGDFISLDSLLHKKERVKGIEKVEILLKICTLSLYNSRDDANKFNNSALLLSQKIGFKEGELRARYNKAYLLFIQGDFDESMLLALDVENDIEYKNYLKSYADISTLKSDIYVERGEYDVALEIGLKLLEKAEQTKNEYLLMKAYAALSHYYLRIGNYSKSLSLCLKGLDYIIKLREIHYFFPKIDEIGRMSAKLNNAEGALKAYSFYLEVEKKLYSPGSYVQSSVYMNMADLYMSIGEYDKSPYYLSQSLELIYKYNFRFRLPRALILQAKLSLKAGDTINAILNYEKSIEAAEDINAFDVVQSNSHILSELYEQTNQLSKSNEYKTLFNAIRDSLFSNEKEQRIIILETKRNVKEITHKKKILELENKAQKSRYNTIIIILAFLFIICGLAVFGYFKVKNKNKLLYRRAIELAQIHLETSEKLSKFENIDLNSTIDNTPPVLSKSNKSIDKDVKEIILSKLEKLEKENFFIDTNCSLHLLSEQLKTNPKYLSQVINREKKSNFNNYINELRINYLLPKLLKDVEFRNSKLSYIAVSLGYNNLNTFNTAFKKRQGILPSYFINELNNELKDGIN